MYKHRGEMYTKLSFYHVHQFINLSFLNGFFIYIMIQTVFNPYFDWFQTMDPTYPRGPRPSTEAALEEIRIFDRDPCTAGGSWDARFSMRSAGQDLS